MSANSPVNQSNEKHWIDLCHVDEVFEGMARRYAIADHPPLAVYNVDGKYFVSDDTCTHGNASLADGWIENGEIECPFHAGKFCLRNGKATNFPAEVRLRVYPCQVVEERVQFDPVTQVSEE
jgi:nitrite reductase/ring-hydroxylating ferredoxin subunit